MGKKYRRNRNNSKGGDDDLENNPHGEDDGNGHIDLSNTKSFNELTFAEKREFRQKQAACKRKAKQQCFLCGQWGHVRRECPGIADDGRGMSRYKGKSDPKGEKLKREQEKERKDREHQQTEVGDRIYEASFFKMVEFPEGFTYPPEDYEEPDEILVHHPDKYIPHNFFDPHCCVLESIAYIQTERAKKSKNKKQNYQKSNADKKYEEKALSALSNSTAIREYKTIWDHALLKTNLSGVIVPTTVQMVRAWRNPLSWLDSDGSDEYVEVSQQQDKRPRKVPICFALGLASTVPCSTEAEQIDAKHLLLKTIEANGPREGLSNPIEALCVILDYTKPKRTRENQRKRLECLLEVSQETCRTLQVQVLPGIPHELVNLDASVSGTDYAQALIDFQATLAQHLERVKSDASNSLSSSTPKGLLQVHLIGWQGRSDHTLSLLKIFAPKGPLPCNLFIGLDPTITFLKATHLHELAFEIPIDRLVLETSQIIPSPITKRLGRHAAPHAAWWPFVAEAVAKHSKRYDIEEVTTVTMNNVKQLYPHLNLKHIQMNAESNSTSHDDN